MAAKTGTYTLIQSTTISGTGTASITFSSIPQTYTDLVIVANCSGPSGDPFVRLNGDSGANYSDTWVEGRASGAVSNRYTNRNFFYFGYEGTTRASIKMNSIFNIADYANTTTYKSSIWRYGDVDYSVEAHVGLWRSTSAITSVVIGLTSGNFNSGSNVKLYGIEAAK
jgi:hypothetical protein